MGAGLTADGERLARVETRQEDHGRQLDLTVPLVGRVEVLDERIDGVVKDIDKGLDAVRAEHAEFRKEIRSELAEIKRDEKSKARERRAMMVAMAVCALGLIGNYWLQVHQLRQAVGK